MTTCTACNGTGIRFLPDAEYHPIQPCFCGAAATEREEKTYAYTQAQYNALLAERDAALAEVKRLLPSDTTETEDTMIIPLPIMDAIERVLEPIISLDPFPDDDSELIDQFKYTPIEVQGEDLVNLFIACSKCLPSDPEHERLCMAVVEAAIAYRGVRHAMDIHTLADSMRFTEAVDALKAYREKKGGE